MRPSCAQVDVEGAEIRVVHTNLLPLLQRHRILHLVMEVTPNWWHHIGVSIAEGAELIHQITKCGYSVSSLTKQINISESESLSFWQHYLQAMINPRLTGRIGYRSAQENLHFQLLSSGST